MVRFEGGPLTRSLHSTKPSAVYVPTFHRTMSSLTTTFSRIIGLTGSACELLNVRWTVTRRIVLLVLGFAATGLAVYAYPGSLYERSELCLHIQARPSCSVVMEKRWEHLPVPRRRRVTISFAEYERLCREARFCGFGGEEGVSSGVLIYYFAK